MAFLKYANATIVRPHISMPAWDEVRAHALAMGSPFAKQGHQQVVLRRYDPKQYMLSHCTIIASVDTDNPGLPLGRQMVDGMQIDRKYADFQVTPDSTKYINNNHDCWERKLLLACFRTFVGGENYVEHLQIPELSKGKIIDAAARDIGDSVYVDILVATDRRHRPLITAIESEQLKTLSMGCQVAFTICTKCGNVAEDETQLCHHIRYQKGNHFIDGLGKQRKIAELCGHINAEPGSVKFIEASWVANPAFTGAVLRNILSPKEQAAYKQHIQAAFSQPARVVDPSAYAKAARSSGFQTQARGDRFDVSAFAFGDEGQGEEEFPGAGGDDGAGAKPEDKKSPFDETVDQVAKLIRERAIEKIRSEMGKSEDVPRADLDENRNDTLIKDAVQRSPLWRGVAKLVLAQVKRPALARKIILGLLLHRKGGWNAVRAAKFTGPECLAISRYLDQLERTPKIAGEARVYRTVVAVGGAAGYADENSYLAACRRYLGRQLTGSETDALLTKGRIYDLGS